ncbi:MAG: AEC family transporter [Clostridia bacterium]|nr:AEC family transporter [Clostridia bacterium]
MELIIQQLFILYLFVVAGWLIGKKNREKASHSEILSVLLVNLLLPCKVFRSFAANFTVAYFKERYTYLFSSLILLAVLIVAGYFGARLMTKHPYERKIFRYSLVVTNYAYLGYVLIESVFGEAMLTDFVFFAIPFIVYTYTFGYALLTGGKKPWKRLLNPITVAIVLGMVFGLSGVSLPRVLAEAISMASSCVGPVSMLLTGLTLSAFALKDMFFDPKPYLFSALRLLLIPATAFLICRLLRLDSVLPMMVMITCMPCGLNTIVFPRLVGEDCGLSARLTLISHLFALPTLMFWLWMLQGLS